MDNKRTDKLPLGMKTATTIVAGAVALLTQPLVAAELKDALQAAADRLAQTNYSWTTTIRSGFTTNITQGKVGADGWIWIAGITGNQMLEGYRRAEGTVVKTDEGWKRPEDFPNFMFDRSPRPDPARAFGRSLASFQLPPQHAAKLLTELAVLKQEHDGEVSGSFTPADAKGRLLSGFPSRLRRAATTANTMGIVRFRIKDGMLVWWQVQLSGSVSERSGQAARPVSRTTTTVIENCGTTKLEVPDEVRHKIGT